MINYFKDVSKQILILWFLLIGFFLFSIVQNLFLPGLRMAIPIFLAALGGLFSERSGVVNIALEGFMLFGAFGGALITLITGNPYIGIIAGIFSGFLLSAIFGFFVITCKADHIITGLAINLFVAGFTVFMLKLIYNVKGSSPQFGNAGLPYVFGISPIIFLSFLIFFLSIFVLYRTVFGLRLRAAGENEDALRVAGVSVWIYRYFAIFISGALSGLAGIYLSFEAGSFTKNISAGRGYIALAALIFGRWRPVPVFMAAMIFGITDAVQMSFQSNIIPTELLQMLPYLITIIVLVISASLVQKKHV